MSAVLREVEVRGIVRPFGFYDWWPERAPDTCNARFNDGPPCGSEIAPHWCQPEADKMQHFFRGLRLTDGDFFGEPFEPLDWASVALDVVWGMKIWDNRARIPGWYRLMQQMDGNIVRGAFKTTFIKGVICWWLRSAKAGRVGAFAQQSKEETLGKLVPGILDMISYSPAMAHVKDQIEWVGQSRQRGGSDRLVIQKEPFGEANLRLVSPATKKSAESARGPRYSFACFDEVGFMGEAEMLIEEVVKPGNLANPAPLWFLFSTQSKDPAHFQRRQCALALEIEQDPTKNPRLWPVNYVSDASVDVKDRSVAINLNPLFRLGRASESVIDTELAAALLDPSKMNTYARERCGYAGDYAVKFMPPEEWKACAVDGGRATILKRMKGLPIFLGSDFSETSDFCAFGAMAFEPNGTQLVCVWHWVPEAAVSRLDALTNGQVSKWIADGWLDKLPEGEELPVKVGQRCLELIAPVKDDVVWWGYDRWHAEPAATLWREAGYHDEVVPINQGPGLNVPIKEAPVLASHGLLAHLNDPVLNYCAMSASKEVDSKDPDKVRLVKNDRGATSERIDGVVAWLTAWQTRIAYNYYQSKDKPPQAAKVYIPRSMREKDGSQST